MLMIFIGQSVISLKINEELNNKYIYKVFKIILMGQIKTFGCS